jgi:hypothetical protein
VVLAMVPRQIALVTLRTAATRNGAHPADRHLVVRPAVILAENVAEPQGDPRVIGMQAAAFYKLAVVPAVQPEFAAHAYLLSATIPAMQMAEMRQRVLSLRFIGASGLP